MTDEPKPDKLARAGDHGLNYLTGWAVLASLVFVGSAGVKVGVWIMESYGYTSGQLAITVDEESYIACDGVTISSDGTSGGQQVYTVSFSGPLGKKTTLRGVHKITTVETSGVCGTSGVPK